MEVEEKLKKYFVITQEAFEKAKKAGENLDINDNTREDFLDMVQRYIKDADYFNDKNDKINALAALSYAHGWLDAGARIGLWDVKDSRLFTVDD
jgi:uncharacterized protein